MDVIRLSLLGVILAGLALLLKTWKPDFLPLYRMAAILLFAVAVLTSFSPLLTEIKEFGNAENNERWELLFKAFGVTLLTQICTDLCKESGESGIASGVEWIGRIGLLLLSLPLMKEIFGIAKQLLSLGG